MFAQGFFINCPNYGVQFSLSVFSYVDYSNESSRAL